MIFRALLFIPFIVFADYSTRLEIINHSPYDLILDYDYQTKMCHWAPPSHISKHSSASFPICFLDSYFSSNLEAYGNIEYRFSKESLPKLIIHAKVQVMRTNIDSTADRIVQARLEEISPELRTTPSLNHQDNILGHVESSPVISLEIQAEEPPSIPDPVDPPEPDPEPETASDA